MSFLTALVIFIGIVYGFSRKGAEDYWQILKKGLIFGLIIGLILAILGFILGGLLAGIVTGVVGGLIGGFGGFVFFMAAVVITIEFIIGAFFGDIIEKILK